MQGLIDAAIGIAKRGTKQLQGHVAARIKDAFSALRAQGLDATQLDWVAVQLDSTNPPGSAMDLSHPSLNSLVPF